MPKTLLLADDSVTIQKVVGISFASEDVTLITVDNGDDAILRAAEERPDAILADVVMPGRNGYEVCEAVKADPALAHIPVLLLTGTFETFDAERAARVGAAGHIAKPFEAQALVEQVKALFLSNPAPAPAPVDAPAADPMAAPESVSTNADGASQRSSDPNADSFDFFDEDLDDAPVLVQPESQDAAAAPMDFAGDSAFQFGEDDLAFDAAAAADPVSSAPEPTRVSDFSPHQLDASDAIVEPEVTPEPAPMSPEPVEISQPDTLEDALSMPIETDFSDSLSIDAETDSGISDELGGSLVSEVPGDAFSEDSLAPLDTASATGDEPFDFAFGGSVDSSDPSQPDADDDLLPVDPQDLAQATTLYPDGGSGYDVSSSDLGPAIDAGEHDGPEATVIAGLDGDLAPSANALDAERIGDLSPESIDTLPDSQPNLAETIISTEFANQPIEPIELDPVSMEPVSMQPEPMTVVALEPEPTMNAQPMDVALEPAPVAAIEMDADLADALSVEPPETVSLDPEPVETVLAPPPVADPMPAYEAAPESPSGDTAARAAAVLEQIEPRLREEIHDTLEKIAWESFSDVTEAIVRQSVEKVEAIAWEIIPQLAETLIREEIRRLKGEPPEDA